MTTALSGRRAQAARNDERILAAARAVFIADPAAPIAAVAERAGVGISALYRRYRSKEELLQKLCAEGLGTYLTAAEAAANADGDPWDAFAEFMRAIVTADVHSLTVRLAGTFTPTEQLYQDASRANDLNIRILDRVRAADAIRPDVEVSDLGLIFEQLAAVRVGDEERTRQLRQRYLELILDALRVRPERPLPGPPPHVGEMASRWTPKTS